LEIVVGIRSLSLEIGGITPAHAEKKTVAITQIVEHPALDACRKGIEDELKARGVEAEFAYESAQGNPGTAAQIARKFAGDAPDVIVAISTPRRRR
jgi:putative ABC transport system substrate-binding protein